MQNMPYGLIGKAQLFADADVDFEQRHRSGEFVKGFSDELVALFGGRFHRLKVILRLRMSRAS